MTKPDFRTLCAELVQAWDCTEGLEYEDFGRTAAYLIDHARAALAQPAPEPPTDEELIQLLFAANARIAELEEQLRVLTDSERIAP